MNARLGLRLDDRTDIMALPIAGPRSSKWTVPRHCDQMEYTLETDDQGSAPSCVGHAFAKNVIAWNWAENDVCQPVPGGNIYARAKQMDAVKGDGTTLMHGAKAAEALHGLKGPLLHVFDVASAQYAIHRFRGYVAAMNAREDWSSTATECGKESSPVTGPHACWICGYDEKGFWIQGSYGQGVGWFGFQRIAYENFKRDHLYGLGIDTRGGSDNG